MTIPAGQSGWWCERCEKPCPSIPEWVDGTQKCPHCKHWAVRWVPPHEPEVRDQPPEIRHRPRAPRAAKLFAHMRRVAAEPNLNPDLAALEHEETIR